MKNRIQFVFQLLLLSICSLSLRAEAQNDIVDATFNANVETTSYLGKNVRQLATLPNGKTLAAGNFNRYNDVPVGLLIRLNADGSLDNTFPNNLVKSGTVSVITLPGEKFFLVGSFTTDGGVQYSGLNRFHADGTVDPTFNYQYTGGGILVDSNGRIYICGNLQIIENGVSVPKHLIRLNDDGTVDQTFNSPLIPEGPQIFAIQNNKVIYTVVTTIPPSTAAISYLRRFNEDGSPDTTFAQTDIGNTIFPRLAVQPSGKILVLDSRIRRVNENGGNDTSFQGITFQFPGTSGNEPLMAVNPDGRITVAIGGRSVIRMGANGNYDPAWVTYNHAGSNFSTFGLHGDGSVLLGDSASNSSSNQFARLLSNGSVDASFNPGGTGFQTIKAGIIRAITVMPDQKVLIGGDFDKVNGVSRAKIARLNADSTLDTSFQTTVSGTGDRFTQVQDVYYFGPQSDGKIIVSGNFKYLIGSTEKANLVRLNDDGTIDPTFNLGVIVSDLFPPISFGRNRPILRADGKALIGTSRNVAGITVPLGLNGDGSKDLSFSPTIFETANAVAVYDCAVLSDGKILISGRYIYNNENIQNGFIARLNQDGTIDQSFNAAALVNKDVYAFSVLSDGKIIAVSRTNTESGLIRLDPDGSLDNSFTAGTGANGKINAIAVLPNGRILVGGSFTTYNGESRQNLAVLSANGDLDAAVANVNNEILCITVDSNGRVLIGGRFTAISSGGQQLNRSYLARLVELSGTINRALFDYDGDGKSDLSVRRPSDGIWHVLRGTAGYMTMSFGVDGDSVVPADYDGDGKTDVAMFRASNSTWYIFNSGSQSFQEFTWGVAGDLPVPADHDGDRKADLVIFRPSTGTWYTRFSNNSFSTVTFGVAGDKPVVGDFDGDGKSDIAVYRPSDGNWHILKTGFGYFAQTWGVAGDMPVPADYDGDGKTDVAIWRPSTGEWYRIRSSAGFDVTPPWGVSGDIPVPADYDGDGKADVAVFRPSNGTWYIVGTTGGQLIQNFGQSGDVPTQSSFIY